MQNRFKSSVVWLALVAQIVSILIVLGVIDTGAGDTINTVAISVCEMLVAFGVLNNPTNKDGF